MRVLQFVAIASKSGAYGGPFDTSKRQVVMARDAGLEVCLWAGALANDEPDSNMLPPGSVIVPVRNWLPAIGFSAVFSWKALVSLFLEIRKSDVVHVSFGRETLPFLASIIAILFHKQLLVQPHGMLTSRTSRLHRMVDLFVKPLVKSSDAVIALTEVERGDLIRWIGKGTQVRWVVMGNPVGRLVDIEPRLRPHPSAKEALWVARLHSRKRVQDFIAAAQLSESCDRDIEFAIVGPDGGDLPAVLRACSTEGNLRYEGSVTSDEVTRRVNSTGVFVLTSSNEPWGNVLATALSLGVPVVLTESSALARTVQAYGAGVVVADASPHLLESAIAELLEDDLRYRGCSGGALKLASEVLSEDVLQGQLLALYGKS